MKDVAAEATDEAGGDRRVRASDLDGLIDSLKTIRGASVVALISEVEPAFHKVSLRALAGAEVARIAQKFGGGGHAKAAGCRMSGSLDSVVARLRSAVKDYLEGR